LETERYASESSVYLPTTAMLTSTCSESTNSASEIHALRFARWKPSCSERRVRRRLVTPWWCSRSGTR
jgi:hypothetical protein